MTSSSHTPSNSEKQVVIIGAGPAGLTAGYELTRAGRRCMVIERDEQVGGLARTIWHNGCGFDIGGHRFFTKNKRVSDLWRELLGADFISVPRLSRIYYRGRFFHYPLRPWNALWGLGIGNSLLVLGSYLRRQARPLPKEDFFEQYVSNRFGDRLYRIFFKTYTEKVWGIPCAEIRSDWAAQRIKGLCLMQAVKSAFLGGPNGDVKTLIDKFDYPHLGPGMLWERMADTIGDAGNTVLNNREVMRIDHDNAGQVLRVVHTASDDSGDVQEATGEYYFSTMPLRTMLSRMNPAPPDNVMAAARALRYRDFITVNLVMAGGDLFPDNWIYVHSTDVRVGRIQNFRNWSRDLVPDANHTGIGMEYFCFEDDDLWAMDDAALIKLAQDELEQLGLAGDAKVTSGFVVRVKKAYPMYDENFAPNIEIIREWLDGFRNLQQLGRNGLHKYNNQDHSMLTGMLGVENYLENTQHDIWAVNTDSNYQETGS